MRLSRNLEHTEASIQPAPVATASGQGPIVGQPGVCGQRGSWIGRVLTAAGAGAAGWSGCCSTVVPAPRGWSGACPAEPIARLQFKAEPLRFGNGSRTLSPTVMVPSYLRFGYGS
jgi:hypothetical protein